MAALWCKYKKGIFMLTVTLLLLCAGLVFQERVSVMMEADMEDKLLEITAQIRTAADQKLEGNFAVLHAISGSLESGTPRYFLESQREGNGFISLGAVDLTGQGIYGPALESRYLPLMTEAFRGNDEITWLARSPFGDRNCVFMAVPLMNGERVAGAVYAVFRQDEIPGLSAANVFGGQGVSTIVGEGFHEAFLEMDAWKDIPQSDALTQRVNAEAKERMQLKLYRSRQGVEKIIQNGQEAYLACVPLFSISGWYVMTTIPATVILKKINDVILLMSLVVIGLCCALLALIWLMENARRKNRQQVFALAYTDRLTGIANWAGCLRSGAKLVEKNPGYALAVVDFDEFHIANGLLGGEGCDRLLRKAAELFSEGVAACERACRVEADRFALLLLDEGEQRLKIRLIDFMQRIASMAPGMNMTLSAGVVRLRDTPMLLSEALECCVLAQKTVKQERCNSLAFYDAAMREHQLRNRVLINDLARAMAEGELLVYLQPKVRLSDGVLQGAEALVRWQHPVYGFLTPAEFVPLLEESGGIERLDCYILRRVCELIQNWKKRGLPLYPISVNLSRKHLLNMELAEDLWDIVHGTGVSASMIELELTESTFFDDQKRIVEIADRLKQKGFLLSVDDFGTGYSLMGVLPWLRIDTVKLDKSLLQALETEGKGFLRDMIAMVRHVGGTVLAEGIEQEAQAKRMEEAGCDLGQGYYYARPMPPDGYERVLKRRVLPNE